jgi:AraC-like DNA-binding protein
MQDRRNTENGFEGQLIPGGIGWADSMVTLPRATAGQRPAEAAIDQAVNFIHRNAYRPFGLRELLEKCAMPRRKFEQEFAGKLGIDPHSFINRCRIERACLLLGERRKRLIKEVALMSGFNSERRFRVVFRRLMGVAPTVYQRKRSRGSGLDWNAARKNHGGEPSTRSRIKDGSYEQEFEPIPNTPPSPVHINEFR